MWRAAKYILLSHIKGVITIKNKYYNMLIGFVLFALVVQSAYMGRNIYIATTAQTSDWGLSFRTAGQAPEGTASSAYLKPYNAYYVGDEAEKVVYLTFDCGYENGYTAAILDVLKEKDVKAAFFVVGHMVQSNPEGIKRMAEEGHLVCNHMYSHPDTTLLSQSEFVNELTKLENTARELCNVEIARFYRPPAGKFNDSTLTYAKEAGYTTVFWSLAYVDWLTDNQPTYKDAMNKLLPRVHSGAIILLHATSKTNAEILGAFIDALREQGYRFATLDELVTAEP